MLFQGEIDADTTVIIDASEDKKELVYEVFKNAATCLNMPGMEILSDSDSDGGIWLNAPISKKMKGVSISSAGK